MILQVSIPNHPKSRFFHLRFFVKFLEDWLVTHSPKASSDPYHLKDDGVFFWLKGSSRGLHLEGGLKGLFNPRKVVGGAKTVKL